VNNLDKHMQEPGADVELYSLIVASLADWDAKMQIECASSFVKPLQMGLVSERNKERTVLVAMGITTDEAWEENEPLITAWIKVLEAVVDKVAPSVLSEHVIAPIKELVAHGNPFARRKLGNRMLFSVAKHTGETFIDTDPDTLKLILSVCRDTNYKIRRDGVIFMREYFEHAREQVVEHYRFRGVYLPELLEFLNDEDSHIRVDAIEAFTVILEDLNR
jgi:hypothetical protein